VSEPNVRYLVLPVSDVAATAGFYAALGCAERGVDGDRWAAMASEHIALSLCGPEDPRRPPEAALAVEVDDVAPAVASALAAGGRLTSPPGDVPVLMTDPDGHPVMLIERTRRHTVPITVAASAPVGPEGSR
jgi:predicted lactoylglutathione lyase